MRVHTSISISRYYNCIPYAISKRTFDWSLFCATICLGFSFLVIHSSNSSHACCVRVPLCFFCVRFVLFLYLFIIIGMSHGMEMKLN